MSTNDQAAISPPVVPPANGGGRGGASGGRPPARPKAADAGGHGFFSLYKPGQGYWTRVLSAIGAGTLVLAGVGWLWAEMQRIQTNTVYWQSGMAVGVITFFGVLLYYLLNKPKIADFMIATEAEMKKVNWPTRREVVGATVVVIAGTLLMCLLLFVVDLLFGWIFLEIGILER